MPRGKKTNGASGVLPKFVSCPLSDEEVRVVQSHLLDDAGVCDYLAKLLDSGHKLSISLDDYNDCVVVTVTLPASEKREEALALPARGPGIYEALSVSAYKFHEKLDGDITSASVEQVKRSWS